jgi:hypothetical protein
MKTATCIVTVMVGFVLAAVPARAATKVFLLGGQSNMAGCGVTADLTTPPYNGRYTDIKVWNSWSNASTVGNAWVDLQGGYGFDGYPGISMFGPEVSFGYDLHNRVFPNDDIYLVKLGANSTTLANQWNPSSATIYGYFKSRVNAAMANLTAAGKAPTIAGMIWMQGESDAMNHTYATAYQTNLTNLIARVRSDFNTPNMPFVIGRINLSQYWGTPADNQLVRDSQVAVAAAVSSVSWIDTDNIPVWTGNEPGHADPSHYNSDGQIILGARFANEFIQTPEPSALVLAGSGLLALAGYWWRRRRFAHTA